MSNNNYKLAIIARISCVCVLLFAAMNSVASIPTLKNSALDFTKIDAITEHKQLAILHNPTKVTFSYKGKEKEKSARFVTSVATINASIDRVRSKILDFEAYTEFMPQVTKAKILSQIENRYEVRYKLKFLLPVIKVTLKYDLIYEVLDNGDIQWTLKKGDMDANMGRWELVALSEEKTMVIYTTWSDQESMGFLIRTVLKAQPDLDIALPISTAALVVDALKKELEQVSGDTSIAEKETPQWLPNSQPPLIANANVPTENYQTLTDMGTLLLIHPAQVLYPENSKKPETILFISAGKIIHGPLNKVKDQTLKFDRYVEFFDQIKEAQVTHKDESILVDWRLKLGFGIISLSVDYTLDYQWINDNALGFTRTEGDLEYIYGCWEWIPLDDDSTLFFYTNASVVGKRGKLLLKLANLIPNKELVVGSSASAVLVEKQTPWIEKNIGSGVLSSI